MQQKFIRVLALLLALALLAPCALGEETAEAPDHPMVRISVRTGSFSGDIYAQLYPEVAPITVENFLKLVDQGFYDGLTFHRVIANFMIQGGDPRGNGTGGSKDTIKGEFSQNGFDNALSHVRGALSMARSQSYDSASSQFFIVHEESFHLDGAYAAFGEVFCGMWVVDRICQETPTEDNNGTVATANQPVIESIRRVDLADAYPAYLDEVMNGAGGFPFQDKVSPIAFPVKEPWRRVGEGPFHETFLYVDPDHTREQNAVVQLARYNNWDRLPAATRAQLESRGQTKAAMDTDAFGSGILSITGLDADKFTEETHSGVKFFTAVNEMTAGSLTYYVGAQGGYVYLFLTNLPQDDPLYPDFLAMLDGLTFREAF